MQPCSAVHNDILSITLQCVVSISVHMLFVIAPLTRESTTSTLKHTTLPALVRTLSRLKSPQAKHSVLPTQSHSH